MPSGRDGGPGALRVSDQVPFHSGDDQSPSESDSEAQRKEPSEEGPIDVERGESEGRKGEDFQRVSIRLPSEQSGEERENTNVQYRQSEPGPSSKLSRSRTRYYCTCLACKPPLSAHSKNRGEIEDYGEYAYKLHWRNIWLLPRIPLQRLLIPFLIAVVIVALRPLLLGESMRQAVEDPNVKWKTRAGLLSKQAVIFLCFVASEMLLIGAIPVAAVIALSAPVNPAEWYATRVCLTALLLALSASLVAIDPSEKLLHIGLQYLAILCAGVARDIHTFPRLTLARVLFNALVKTAGVISFATDVATGSIIVIDAKWKPGSVDMHLGALILLISVFVVLPDLVLVMENDELFTKNRRRMAPRFLAAELVMLGIVLYYFPSADESGRLRVYEVLLWLTTVLSSASVLLVRGLEWAGCIDCDKITKAVLQRLQKCCKRIDFGQTFRSRRLFSLANSLSLSAAPRPSRRSVPGPVFGDGDVEAMEKRGDGEAEGEGDGKTKRGRAGGNEEDGDGNSDKMADAEGEVKAGRKVEAQPEGKSFPVSDSEPERMNEARERDALSPNVEEKDVAEAPVGSAREAVTTLDEPEYGEEAAVSPVAHFGNEVQQWDGQQTLEERFCPNSVVCLEQLGGVESSFASQKEKTGIGW
uniref:Uncharacterized protein n=1 Tax=Chromera velia CCMP2878 TaxID=1169474 RepID=A0A0G4I260_9ALVE|eukprot:Cvel_1694.t1-p1 / transcript=Cvel_1694.t1 / gene=Cvel_1694 / organism=Chromera_velia_CCMP2878 / gene_product=hypothetical protein / transcript_product=hypothetical protein / location=Cvel_scaffold61:12375-15821(+) / protein_length=641 / sequence_SO=supercontig / SO=protein_coding / is_pseudo=false